MNGDLSGRSSPSAASAGASHLRREQGEPRLPGIVRTPGNVGFDRVPGIDGSAHGSDENLWRRHLYMGVGSFVFGGLLLLIYIILTFHDPHRAIMLAIDVATIVGSLVIIGPVGSLLLTTRWRDAFFFSWSVGTVAVIAIPIALDGGAGSPLAGLLVLPVLFGGLLYHVRAVIGLAVVALGSFFLIFFVGEPVSGTRALATAIMIGVAGGIATTAAMNRAIWEQERKALIETLHRLATHDGLTGCLSYQAFQDGLTVEWARARRHDRPFSLVIADLDGFKAINDLYGHAVGDEMLSRVAHALLVAVRSTDVVGRIGGDEFAVLLPETPTAEARLIVQRMQAEIRRATASQVVTLSFGVSTWQRLDDVPGELLQQADAALYEAKRCGRNRVVVGASLTSPARSTAPAT